MNIYICYDLGEMRWIREGDTMHAYIDKYFGALISQNKTAVKISLDILIQTYEKWVRGTNENCYYVYKENDSYIHNYYSMQGIKADSKIIPHKLTFAYKIEDMNVSDEQKKNVYSEIYKDLHHDLPFARYFLVEDEEKIESELKCNDPNNIWVTLKRDKNVKKIESYEPTLQY